MYAKYYISLLPAPKPSCVTISNIENPDLYLYSTQIVTLEA